MVIPFLRASLSVALLATVPASSATPTAPSPAKADLAELPAAGIPATWIGDNAPTTWQAGHLYLYECWATWCGPCIASMPHLEELHRTLKSEKAIHILGLNLDNDMTPERLREFVENRLHVTFPIGIASEQTQKLWLQPLNVRAIPFAFAVRDGKVVWKGSPRQLTADMLKRLAQGQEATDGPPPDPARQRQDMLVCIRGMFEALARDDIAEAKRIAAEEDARKAKGGAEQHGMALFLLRAMVSTRHPDAAVTEAAELAKRQPENAAFLLKIADALSGPLLKSEKPLTEPQRPALETALKLARQAAGLEEKAGQARRYTPVMIAGMLEKLGRNAEAKPFLLQGIERSDYGTAWNMIQEETQENIPLAEILEGSVKAVIALSKSSSPDRAPKAPAVWEEAGEGDPLRSVFEKTDWRTAFKPRSAPSRGTLLISLQRRPERLNAKLRLHGWNRPTLYRAHLAWGPQLDTATAPAEPSYPVGHLTDTAPLMRLLGDEQLRGNDLPEVILWRDGHLLWKGEAAFLPSWLGKVLDDANFDFSRFQEARRSEESKLDRLRGIVKQAMTLNREEKWDESRALLDKHLDELYVDPGLALFAEECLAGHDLQNKDYAAVVKRFQRLMKQFPLEFLIYSNIHKMLGSNERLQSAAYPAALQALQGMADTNLRADPEYNAACYAVMARLALAQKQNARARELALRALAESELAHRYLGIAP